MGDRYPLPVFLDATVVSNFASTDAIGFLVAVLGSPLVVPAVREEIERGQNLGHEYLASAVEAFDDEGIGVADPPDGSVERGLRNRLDAGEAETLRAAAERGGTIATDDLAARRLAGELSIPVVGSIGLLVVGVERGEITRETADAWLETWREERGYYAPVERIGDVLDGDG
ncbi:hypothetical protein [Halobellus rubicundus]|uniref:DUF3368 domain-containing protein n=1 Tax=Halobellus rubicundus TaxID=2996466 RepID=A0ABD5MDB4_9EURY